MNFVKGDILIGQKRAFDEAYHPIVYIDGPDQAPLAVILTHSNNFPCNKKLLNVYDGKENKTQYFVAHLIEKMTEWGHYEKIGKVKPEDLKIIADQVRTIPPMTWEEYMVYMNGANCPTHTT